MQMYVADAITKSGSLPGFAGETTQGLTGGSSSRKFSLRETKCLWKKQGERMDYQKLNHTTWNCKYHIVFIPKRRKKVIFGQLRRRLGEIFHELASQRHSQIVEGHLLRDHVRICMSIPPKYAVLGDSGIGLFSTFGEFCQNRNIGVYLFWRDHNSSKHSYPLRPIYNSIAGS